MKHRFENSDPTTFDANCAVCDGKHRDAVHGVSIYADCVRLGVPVQNHASDLYIPVNDATRLLLKAHGLTATTFTNQVEGGLWYDVPFAFDPYWEAKQAKGGVA